MAAVFALAIVAEAQTICPGQVAQIISPTPGSTLPAGAVTFTWCHASGDYFLDIESVPGAHDIFFAFPVGVESVTLGPACAPTPPVGCIPPNGETIYVTLWTNLAQSGRKNYVAAPTLTFTAASSNPTPFQGGVVNAGSFAAGQAVTPGSIVAIFGSNLAPRLTQASTIPLSTSLDHVSVTFNNIPAPLFAVIPQGPGNPAQINAQLPWNVLPPGQLQGTVEVVVTNNGKSSAPVNVAIAPFGPGVFAFNVSGSLRAIAISTDGALPWPVGAFPGLSTRPAKQSGAENLQSVRTMGAVDSPVLGNGYASFDKLRRTTTMPTVLFGGAPATDVQFSGLAPTLVGVNQVNVVVPPNAPVGSAVAFQIRIGGITSTDQVSIAIE